MSSQLRKTPYNFNPAREVTRAHILEKPPAFASRPRRKIGRKWQGLKYEASGHTHLAEAFLGYTPGPWIQFTDGPTGERRLCQPDGLLVEPKRGRITVIEFKYRHSELAYWQLFHLYIPVVQALFPARLWAYAGVEVCSRYDCAVVCPERPFLRKNILDAAPLAFNVHIWRP